MHEYGSGGAEIAWLVAQELGWELMDRSLLQRIARVADLNTGAERFDAQAARWCEVLRSRGVNLDQLSPAVAPRWIGEIDDESIHALATELVRAATDFCECVITVPGAQCLLRTRSDVFNVLAYAPTADRVARIHRRCPECADPKALVKEMDAHAANYMVEHYESEWLGAGLFYDLCVNTSNGLHASAALIHAEVTHGEKRCTPIAEEELSPCHAQHQL